MVKTTAFYRIPGNHTTIFTALTILVGKLKMSRNAKTF